MGVTEEVRIAIYPGSFDPVTFGHLDIIRRAARIFDKVKVTVFHNSAKKPLFSIDERVEMLKEVTMDLENVEVDLYEGLLTDYARASGASVIIKGLRAVSDYEYEFKMAMMNKKLAPEIETLFMVTSHKFSFLSSSIVKEVASYGGCVDQLVPPNVKEKLIEKFS